MADCVLDENVSESLAPALQSLGHDAVTTTELGRKGATDVSQLSFAARMRRVLITYDTGHYEMLHEAWRTWSADWSVADRAHHAGILLLPDLGVLPTIEAARVIGELLARACTLGNRLFVWEVASGWHEITVDQ